MTGLEDERLQMHRQRTAADGEAPTPRQASRDLTFSSLQVQSATGDRDERGYQVEWSAENRRRPRSPG
jgi:hypothetical protein